MKFLLVIPCIAILIFLHVGCCSNDKSIKQQQTEDVRYFFSCFINTHPDPYSKVSPKQIDSIKANLLWKIDMGITQEQFLIELGKLNGLLDGHSYIDSPLLAYTSKDSLLLPISIRMNTDLTLSLNNEQLQASNIIVSINGIPSRKLVGLMNSMLNKDPGVVAKTKIESFFPILLIRANIFAPYTIKVKNGQRDTCIHVQGACQVGYSKQMRSLQLKSDPPELDSNIFPNSKMAILYFNTCNPKNEDEFKTKIDQFFSTIQRLGIKHLFIDNSRNSGGSSTWGYYLISKLNHQEFHYSFAAYVRKSEASERVIAYRTDSGLAGTFNRIIPEVTNGFSGKVYMLLSSNSGSAGSNAAWIFRFAKVGKILGDKSGSGNPQYVYPAEFALPNSKVKFRISVRKGGYITYEGGKECFLKEQDPDIPFNINPYKISYNEQELLGLLMLVNKKYNL